MILFIIYLFKSTNNKHLIHFNSHQNNKIKSEAIVDFYLSYLSICGLQFLPEEEKYIENTFKLIQYPNNFQNKPKREKPTRKKIQKYKNAEIVMITATIITNVETQSYLPAP